MFSHPLTRKRDFFAGSRLPRSDAEALLEIGRNFRERKLTGSGYPQAESRGAFLMQTCSMCTKWHDEPEFRITELDCCYVMLNRDQFFPGYTFVFMKKHIVELFHLDRTERAAVLEEVTTVAASLYDLFKPAKMNYELLGNMVPHMHWHLIPRFTGDPLWPRPIWSEPHEPLSMTPENYASRIGRIRAEIATKAGHYSI